MSEVRATGRCLCGAVSFEINGPLRDVVICHCIECRRWHGTYCASTAAKREDVHFTQQRGLRWIQSPQSDAHARRAFCGECGSSLFWDAPERPYVAIAAGLIDGDTGLKLVSHWYTSQKGDWYELPDDGLPKNELSGTATGVEP